MNEVTTLVEKACSAIDDFEEYIFNNYKTSYFIVKDYSEQIRSRIDVEEEKAHIGDIIESQKNLNKIVSEISTIHNSFKENGNNIQLTINSSDNYITTEKEEEKELPKFTDFVPISTSAVKITNYTPEMHQEKEDSDNANAFEKALDVDAIEAFLNKQGYSENETTPIA